MNIGKKLAILSVGLAFTAGCGGSDDSAASGPEGMAQLQVPANFSFNSAREIQVSIDVRLASGGPAPGTPVMVFADPGEEIPLEDAMLLARGLTDASGLYTDTLAVPARYGNLRVVASTFGMANDVSLPVADVVSHTFSNEG